MLKKPYKRFGSIAETLNREFYLERCIDAELLDVISKFPHAEGEMIIIVSN